MTNPKEQILRLAKKNASRVKLFNTLKDVDTSNCFEAVKIDQGQASFDCPKFPSPERYQIVKAYLEEVFADPELKNLSAYFSINIYDGNSGNNHTLDFSKLPDLYQMNNYKGTLSERDLISFEHKKDRILFIGSISGELDPLVNQRLRVCAWGLDQDDIGDFLISSVITPDVTNTVITLTSLYGQRYSKFLSDFMPTSEQLSYKFILSIDGNVASWDRPVWILNSGSLLFKLESSKSDHHLWYYPLLNEDIHYVSVTTENMREKFKYYLAHPELAKQIIGAANDFVRTYLKSESHLCYTRQLFKGVCLNSTTQQ